MVIVVRDPGGGFDPGKIPSPIKGENVYSDHGRGIFLINRLMDDVEYRGGGTEIWMRTGFLFLARLAAMRRFIEVQKSIEQERERLAAILESVGEGVADRAQPQLVTGVALFEEVAAKPFTDRVGAEGT